MQITQQGGGGARLVTALLALMLAIPAQAALVRSMIDETSGTGLGTVNTVLTVSAQDTETGCVGREAGVDVVGGTSCTGGNAGGDEQTGDSQTQTQSIADLGLATAQELRIVFNANENSADSITLENLSLAIYSDSGTLLFTTSGTFTPVTFPFTFSGVGSSGFVFEFDSADASAAQPFFADPTNRIGLSATLSETSAGPETFYVADSGAVSGASADLVVTKTASADPVQFGGSLTYTITVRNDGPNTATNVVVQDPVPGSLEIVSFTTSQGSCSQSGSVVTCNVGTLGMGQTATIQIVTTARAPGQITNTATASANQADPVTANNTGTVVTTVLAPVGGPAPIVQQVPSLSIWTMALLGILLLGTVVFVRSR